MNTTKMLKLMLTCFFMLGSSLTFAQDTTQDEDNVWAIVEAVWNADEKGERDWTDRFLVDGFTGWSKSAPVPRDKSSTKMWDRFNEQIGKSVEHELYPYAIVVHGDTAVAHYLYSNAFKNKDGDIELQNGRYTDVLVRTDDGWKLVAWHGGDND